MRQHSLVTALLITGCLSFLPALIQAQPHYDLAFKQQKPPKPAKPSKPPKPNKGAPFDGSLSLFIAVGALYTAKKAYDKMKMETLNQPS